MDYLCCIQNARLKHDFFEQRNTSRILKAFLELVLVCDLEGRDGLIIILVSNIPLRK